VRVRELAAQPVPSGEHDAAVVEGGGRQVVDRIPPRVNWNVRIDAELDQTEVRGRELPGGRVARRIAVGRELLQVRHPAHVDLRREMAADRRLERLACLEQAAGESPGAAERVATPFPQQDLERPVTHLQDYGGS